MLDRADIEKATKEATSLLDIVQEVDCEIILDALTDIAKRALASAARPCPWYNGVDVAYKPTVGDPNILLSDALAALEGSKDAANGK